jgi:excisionase family DNA binding protein
MTEHPDDILTVDEIAAVLRMGRRKVMRLLNEGKIRGRLDYRWTARRAAVMAYDEQHTSEVRPNRRRGRGRRAA